MVSAIGKPVRKGAEFGIARDAHDAGKSLNDLIVGGPARPGAVLSKTRDCAIDDTRVALCEHLIAEPQPLHHLRAEILQHDVRRLDKAQENLLAFVGLEIDRDGLLVRIHRDERQPHQVLRHRGIGAEPARKIAALRILDLDDLGAETRKLIAAEGAGQHVGQIEDANAGERQCHVVSSG